MRLATAGDLHQQLTMRRFALVAAVIILAPLLGGAASPGVTTPELEAAGWRKVQWHGIRPAEFTATANGVRVRANGEASFIARPLRGDATCLSWRWRVDAGPPPTDLTRRGGDDRALSIAIGFAGFGPDAGFATRTRHAVAQAAVTDALLPRSVLMYVWGGTGREGEGGFFASPWSTGIGMLRVMQPADAPSGRWIEQRVDLVADWRAAFGGRDVPPLLELTIATDSEDTGTRVDAQVENIRLVPCN
jgi:hypothetical protein